MSERALSTVCRHVWVATSAELSVIHHKRALYITVETVIRVWQGVLET